MTDDASSQPAKTPVLTVTYTGEPDVDFTFAEEGQRRTFGRDDSRCDIVVWSAINSARLSAVAGEIWRMDDELWVRNLSTAHDLYLEVPSMPPEAPLPPRTGERDRGAARSIPSPVAYVRGPDGCELLVRQGPASTARARALPQGTGTTRVPQVPHELRRIALALCEPLLNGGQFPASYAEIGRRTGNDSRKAIRNRVEQLTSLYLDEIPALRIQQQDRLDREAERLGLPEPPRVIKGIARFDLTSLDLVDEAEQERRRALALPTYFEVAQLLVRRRVLTRADLVEEFGPVDAGPGDPS